MTIFARMIRFLFWLFVLSWSTWVLRRIIAGIIRNAAGSPAHKAATSGAAQTSLLRRRLVRDPVCGVHLDETLSMPLREGGELHHFCSVACRDAFAVDVRKFAANG